MTQPGVNRRSGQARVFPARMDAFTDVAEFVDRVGADAGFGRDDRLRLTLLLEELFTNTVTHGHGGDSEASVHLTLEVQPGRIAVTYEDTAPPFDPFAAVADPALPVEIDERPAGGFGLLLVARMSAERAYVYADGRNRISLVVCPGSAGPGVV